MSGNNSYEDPLDAGIKGGVKGFQMAMGAGKALETHGPVVLQFLATVFFLAPLPLMLLIRTGFGIRFLSAVRLLFACGLFFAYWLIAGLPLLYPLMIVVGIAAVVQLILARRSFIRGEQHVDSVGYSLLLRLPGAHGPDSEKSIPQSHALLHGLLEPALIFLTGMCLAPQAYAWAEGVGGYLMLSALSIMVIMGRIRYQDHQHQVQMNRQHFGQRHMQDLSGAGPKTSATPQSHPAVPVRGATQSTPPRSTASASQILARRGYGPPRSSASNRLTPPKP